MFPTKRKAFTLVELLVVIAIIGVLVALMLPAIQAAREAARRSSCMNKLAQIALALQNYESAHLSFPTGVDNPTGPILNEQRGNHLSWIVRILPFIEEQNTYQAIDQSAGAYAAKNRPARNITLALLQCPSSAYSWEGPNSSYAGCHHDVEAPIDDTNHGVFYRNSRTTPRDVSDGLSQTIFVGEINDDITVLRNLCWMSGTRATLRNTGAPPNQAVYTGKKSLPTPIEWYEQNEYEFYDGSDSLADAADDEGLAEPADDGAPPEPEETAAAEADDDGPSPEAATFNLVWVGGFGSEHSGDIALFVFGDGHVTSLTSMIAPTVFQQLGHRGDGKLLDRSDLDW
ncbi:MAG: DUF1559 domain-containing protein [Planctomycetales bacterium]|nr:DUF1559 domain-containing protein [Planctomycetales bacterium]